MTTSQFSPDAQRDIARLLDHDQQKNAVNVYSFDPAATPQEKAAAASKGSDPLESSHTGFLKKPTAVEIAIDNDSRTSNITPTITVSDADDGETRNYASKNMIYEDKFVPGTISPIMTADIPEWSKVGWRATGGIDTPPAEGEEKDRSILDMYLAEQFYGSWYHNSAIIFFAVFSAHFLTLFGLGIGWHFIVLAICSTYYSTSVRRVRRRARDDIQRELVKTRLISEHETADWINNFLDRFWLIYEPILSATIVSSVDQILSTSTPAFLDSIRLSTFTLGTKAPRIDKVRTFPRTPDDIVIMDWELSFTPSDISEITPLEAQKRVNPKIVLSVRVGKGLATAAIPILLEDINFTGHLRIRLKLMTTFPHIQVVDLSFLEKPCFDYVLKPIGGDTFGFDIGNIPGLSAFIREIVHANLRPMMYDPNVFTLNLEQMLSGTPIDSAIGVLQVTVHLARGLKGTRIGGGLPDPYVSLSINGRAEMARTNNKHNTFNPAWGETKFLLINSLSDSLNLTVYDYNDHRKDYEIGTATFDMSKLLEDANQEDVEVKVLKDGKEKGDLRFSVSFYPVLKQAKNGAKEEAIPDTKVGIVRVTVHQAKDLDHTKSLSGDLNPFTKLLLGGKVIHNTPRVKHTNNPVWEFSTEFLCSDKAASIITAKIIDDREFMKDPVVGYLSIKLKDLLLARHSGDRDWWPLSNCRSGRLRMSAEWKPLNMAGSMHGADKYVPPIGIVRLWLQRATDIKNVEAALGGKSDPYVRVQINNVTMGRTEVVNNDLNPEWDQIIYIPVHTLKELLFIECMDYQHLTKDRPLGSVELKVSDLAIKKNDIKYPYSSTGKKIMAEPLRLDKGNVYKGTLHLVAEFVPSVAVKGIRFYSESSDLWGKDDTDDGQQSLKSGSVVSDTDLKKLETVPEGITASRPVNDDQEISAKRRRKARESIGSMDTIRTTGTSDSAETAPESNTSIGIEMSKEELLRHQSGIIVFNVRAGQLHQKARLEILLDDGYWPAFSTVKARSVHIQWDHVGEGFIKELDFGRVWLRLNISDEGGKDDVVADFKCDSRTFLEGAMDGPNTYTLLNADGQHKSTIEIEARYVPVDIVLEPRESINNQGILRVDLIAGSKIRGIDRGGKSDPFVVFSLNDSKIYKSQTRKKTLAPEWKESFQISIPSRVAAKFLLEVFDWNQIENAKSIGSAMVELADLEPFERAERIATLTSDKYGETGQISLALLFTPEIIARTRKNTSTFSTAGRAMTQIGSLPVGAGRGVIHGVGNVGRGVHDIFIKDNGKRLEGILSEDYSIDSAEAGQAAIPDASPNSTLFPSVAVESDSIQAPVAAGTLRVVVLGAKDILTVGSNDNVKPYVVIKVGEQEQRTRHSGKTKSPEWNESFIFAVGASTLKLYATLFDHKTLGKDRVLGEAAIDIWRHIHSGTTAADVWAELNEGHGLLRLQLDFDPGSPPSSIEKSSSTLSERGSLGSPSRFSLTSRR